MEEREGMSQPSQNQIIDAIEQGMKKAQRDSIKYSNRFAFQAPEYLSSVYVYQRLGKLYSQDWLSFETKSKDVDALRILRPPGRKPNAVKGNGRCDLVLWNTRTNRPRAVVEFKKRTANASNDLKRLSFLVGEGGLDFAISASFGYERVAARGTKQLPIREQTNNVVSDLKKTRPRVSATPMLPPSISQRIDPEGNGKVQQWMWCPVCILLK